MFGYMPLLSCVRLQLCVCEAVGSKVDMDIFLNLTLVIGAGPLTALSFLGSASLANHLLQGSLVSAS